MKKEKVEVYQYILDQEEAKVVKNCLDYCWHRITKHGKTVMGTEREINKLRKELDKK